jgi:P-type conjugative transfer protein TrbJ
MPSRRLVLAAALAVSLCGAGAARAQLAVYDAGNYSQNLVQAARALEQINNQIASLQNQAQMLAGQARNLANLPQSSLSVLTGQIARTQALIGQAQKLAYDVGDIQAAFKDRYGAAAAGATSADLVARADGRWATSVAGFEDALKVQAGVIGDLGLGRAEMEKLVDASQGAVGALQAAQAGNQILALQAQQLSSLTALAAAQGRAQALEAADRAAARADAKARFSRFMGRDGQ